MLINAVKELNKKNEAQQKEIDELKSYKKEVEDLKTLVKQFMKNNK